MFQYINGFYNTHSPSSIWAASRRLGRTAEEGGMREAVRDKGFKDVSKESGLIFLNGKNEDPSFAQPLSVSLFQQQDGSYTPVESMIGGNGARWKKASPSAGRGTA